VLCVFFKFWAHEILPKFWRYFRRNFRQGKVSSKVWKRFKLSCQKFLETFVWNFDKSIIAATLTLPPIYPYQIKFFCSLTFNCIRQSFVCYQPLSRSLSLQVHLGPIDIRIDRNVMTQCWFEIDPCKTSNAPVICLKLIRKSQLHFPGIGRKDDDWSVASVCALYDASAAAYSSQDVGNPPYFLSRPSSCQLY